MRKNAKGKTIPEIWQAFARATIKLDKANDKPNGWHWLCAIHRLEGRFPKINRTYIIREHLTDGTQGEIEIIPQKFSNGDGFYDVIQKLIKDLGNPKKIIRIDFSGLKFKKSDNFLNFIFPVDVSFARTTFAGIANFCHTDFQAADFSKAIFLDHVNFYSNDFDSTVFNGVANFDKVIFSNCADFNNADFRKKATFTNTKFYQKKSHITYFSKAGFSEKIVFNNAEFHCEMCFTDAKFAENTFFENAVFFKNSYFTESKFSKTASFKSTTFSENVHFDDAIFFDTADFEDAEFHAKKGTHLKSARFRNTNFKKIANFKNATFWRYANFKGANFSGRTTFQKTKFKCNAPRFYYATFNYEMTFLGMIPPKFWLTPNENIFKLLINFFPNWHHIEKRYKQYKQRIQENQNSYENTAILLEKQGKYHDRHFFFRQEMRCRRRLEGPFNFTTYGIYEYLANYGYGVGRALLGWLVHILGGALILAYNRPRVSLDDFGCSLGISLSNSHAFFFKGKRLKDCYDVFESLPWFNVIWGVQTIMGTLLIFLVLLTLRVRFRLK